MTDHSLHFDPSCEECAYLARPVAIPVPPSPVAGLREAAESAIRLLSVIHLSADVEQADMQAGVAVETLRAALLAEPVPPDVERLAKALMPGEHFMVAGLDALVDPEQAPRYAEAIAAEYARLTDPKGADHE